MVTPEGVLEVEDARAATSAALERIFRGVAPGREIAERAPLRLELPAGGGGTFQADPRMTNGWSYANARVRFDVGPHAALAEHLTGLVAGAAEEAWARGVVPGRALKLGADFSFDAFVKAPEERCRQLVAALAERVRCSPAPSSALEAAVEELRALGHDLWDMDGNGHWGPDYVTKRPGRGLQISLIKEDDDDGAPSVEVEFCGRE